MVPGSSTARASIVSIMTVMGLALAGGACRPSPGGWGRVRILESHLGPTSWTVLVADQGQGAELTVDGSPRQGKCRRVGQGIRCWVGGLRPGYHRLGVTVAGKGTSRRSALSATRKPVDEVIYEVLLDRFADGDAANNLRVNRMDPAAAHGGDLRGLRKRLGHLKRLGVTTLLVSPLWEPSRVKGKTGALPRYVGLRTLRPRVLSRAFGSPRALMRLLRAARRRGLRVVLDLPRTGTDLQAYLALVRTWLTRTLADGARLGPFRAGEEQAWAAATRRLSDAFTPLLLIHHGSGDVRRLRAALAKGRAGAGLIESDSAGKALLSWVTGTTVAGASAPGGLDKPLPRGVVRVLSTHRAPVLARRFGRRSPSRPASPKAARAADRAALTLTLHLLLAEIPKVYYADEIVGSPAVEAHPDMDWSETKPGPRQRLIRKILGLRRGVAALRRGRQRVVAKGDVLLLSRALGGCRVIVAANRSDKVQKLVLDTTQLGWPPQPGEVELVDRLKGRGYTLAKNRITVELKPVSARVLVPAGSGACSD